MAGTATVERKKPATETKLERSYVLVRYNPSEGIERGLYTESSFMTIAKTEKGLQPISIRPGIQRMTREEWALWEASTAADVVAALAEDVLRLVSEETDIAQMTTSRARAIIKETIDVPLLTKWSTQYAHLEPPVQQALELRSQSIDSSDKPQRSRYLFGTQVA